MAVTESDAVRVAREFREQLARNEDAALRRMSRYWMKMEKTLEPRFFALAQEIKDLQDSGQPVPPQLIYNRQRYLDMMAQIMEEIPDYEKYAVDIITEYQIENFNLGLDDASAVIRATRPSSPVWNYVGKDAVETMAGFAGNGAPLAELMQHDYGDLGVKVTDALVQGIGLGKGAHAVAKDMRDAMGMEFNRSVRIARTEINRAYRIANAEQYAKSGVVTKVLRLCYAPTACLACLAMDGEECPNGICDDHPNGKCTTVAVTIGGNYPQWQHGLEWLEEQSEEDQLKIMGDGRYEMWKKDGIPLRDMVEMKPNPVWGGSPTIISERELRERYNLTGGNRMLFSGQQKSAPTAEPPKSYTFRELMGKAYEGNKYTPEQMQQIETMYENMPSWLQPFYNKYGGELQPIVENNEGVVPRKKTDFGYFTPAEGDSGRVHFLASRDAAGRSDQNPFELGAHEYGHNIDFLAGGKNRFEYLSNQYRDENGKSFLQIINDEFDSAVRKLVGKEVTPERIYEYAFERQLQTGGVGAEQMARSTLMEWRMLNKLDRKDPQYLALRSIIDNAKSDADYKNFFMDHANLFRDFVTKDTEGAYKQAFEVKAGDISRFCKMIKGEYSMAERGCLSDIFENYSVTHGGGAFPFGVGHGTSYAKEYGATEREAFAEMLECTICNPGGLQVIQKYIPNAYNAFKDMIQKAVK